jgi:hypothetical protein
MTLFSAVVAPTAFRELPSTQIAALVVGPVLRAVHLYGAAAGLLLAALTLALDRGRWLAGLAVALSALSLVSHFGVTAEISELRAAAFGPSADPEALARFNQLHRLSVWIYGTVGLGALALAVLHARIEGGGGRPRKISEFS